MQLIAIINAEIQIKCPVCDSEFENVADQQGVDDVGDRRVRIMWHPKDLHCPWSHQKFRVDRLTGYAERWPALEEAEHALPESP